MNSFIAAVMRAQKQGQGVWHIDILSPETLVEDWLQLKQRPSARLRRQWKRTQEMIAGLYGSSSPGLCLLCDNGFATQDPAALAVLSPAVDHLDEIQMIMTGVCMDCFAQRDDLIERVGLAYKKWLAMDDMRFVEISEPARA